MSELIKWLITRISKFSRNALTTSEIRLVPRSEKLCQSAIIENSFTASTIDSIILISISSSRINFPRLKFVVKLSCINS